MWNSDDTSTGQTGARSASSEKGRNTMTQQQFRKIPLDKVPFAVQKVNVPLKINDWPEDRLNVLVRKK